MKKIIIGFFLWSLGLTFAHAGIDPAQELAAIRKIYESADVCHYGMTYKLFDAQTNALLETRQAVVTTEGEDYHLQVAGLEYLRRKGKFVYIDHNHKKMLFYSKIKAASGQKSPLNQFRALLSQKGVQLKIEYISALQRKLTLDLPGNKSTKIYYDASSYTIERMENEVVHPNNPTKRIRMEVTYSDFSRGKKGFEAQINQFVVPKSKSFEVNTAYKAYQFNHIQ
jgi:hypothetical protein